jgi:ATP-dependent Clp protease ATP-binding subunit ClpB
VIFHRLSREDVSKIVELQVELLTRRVSERGIEIELTDDARTLIGNLGFDPTYGARPLRRVIQRQLVDPLALRLLEGDFADGSRIRVDAEDGGLVFRPAPSAVADVA